MLTFRDFVTGLRKLDIDRSHPVIVHASLSAFGEVQRGVETVLGALGSAYNTLVMPAFTYKAMITPEQGPPANGLAYGSGKDTNRMAQIFTPDMPADPLMGVLAEALRAHPKALRSSHPILSFTGMNAHDILAAQTIHEPLLPVKMLAEAGGWVLLMGVGHNVNTSIHYAEKVVGRKQFIRWALTPGGVIPCQGFPGCSNGFSAISSYLYGVVRKIELGDAVVQAVPLKNLLDTVCQVIEDNPSALLCSRIDCERCNAVRESVR